MDNETYDDIYAEDKKQAIEALSDEMVIDEHGDRVVCPECGSHDILHVPDAAHYVCCGCGRTYLRTKVMFQMIRSAKAKTCCFSCYENYPRCRADCPKMRD